MGQSVHLFCHQWKTSFYSHEEKWSQLKVLFSHFPATQMPLWASLLLLDFEILVPSGFLQCFLLYTHWLPCSLFLMSFIHGSLLCVDLFMLTLGSRICSSDFPSWVSSCGFWAYSRILKNTKIYSLIYLKLISFLSKVIFVILFWFLSTIMIIFSLYILSKGALHRVTGFGREKEERK